MKPKEEEMQAEDREEVLLRSVDPTDVLSTTLQEAYLEYTKMQQMMGYYI